MKRPGSLFVLLSLGLLLPATGGLAQSRIRLANSPRDAESVDRGREPAVRLLLPKPLAERVANDPSPDVVASNRPVPPQPRGVFSPSQPVRVSRRSSSLAILRRQLGDEQSGDSKEQAAHDGFDAVQLPPLDIPLDEPAPLPNVIPRFPMIEPTPPNNEIPGRSGSADAGSADAGSMDVRAEEPRWLPLGEGEVMVPLAPRETQSDESPQELEPLPRDLQQEEYLLAPLPGPPASTHGRVGWGPLYPGDPWATYGQESMNDSHRGGVLGWILSLLRVFHG